VVVVGGGDSGCGDDNCGDDKSKEDKKYKKSAKIKCEYIVGFSIK
jgi:hypothetical protein